jgi:apolipoprotein N-acyltransferase
MMRISWKKQAMKKIDWKSGLIIVATIISFSLLSPRWTFPIAAFIAPAFLIHLNRDRSLWHSIRLSFLILAAATMIANYKVMPFPLVLFIPVSLQVSLLATIPYVIYERLSRQSNRWTFTLFFPVLQVLLEYANSFFGGGTWGSIAYSQIDNAAFVQLASITGMWGVTFMVYWFSSLLIWALQQNRTEPELRVALGLYGGVTATILIFGVIRINDHSSGKAVRVSGVTGLNNYLLGIIYEDAFSKKIDFDPAALTQTSPELQELNKGLIAFVADPYSARFNKSQFALREFQDSMFTIAGREARAGSKIISFSEALMFTFKPSEEKLIRRGQEFAKENKVTLLLAVASFIPGKIEFGTKYLENKAILIDPFGHIENIFYKNRPVPVVEPSITGDGEIPVYRSLYGKLGISICYDADFPSLIRKAGQQKADILLLPAADWREISPYHANMSRMRAIENGFSILRPVSNASSMACDYTGKVLASRNFFDEGDKVATAYLPVNGRPTPYGLVGDYFPWLCVAVGVAGFFVSKRKEKIPNPTDRRLVVEEI